MNAPAAALKPAPRKPRPDQEAELNNLAMSKEAQPLYDAVVKHIEENVAPITEEFFRLGERPLQELIDQLLELIADDERDKDRTGRPH